MSLHCCHHSPLPLHCHSHYCVPSCLVTLALLSFSLLLTCALLHLTPTPLPSLHCPLPPLSTHHLATTFSHSLLCHSAAPVLPLCSPFPCLSLSVTVNPLLLSTCSLSPSSLHLLPQTPLSAHTHSAPTHFLAVLSHSLSFSWSALG